nr:unnamed protein product [Spirometra erinaceieuropaei]
MISPSGEDASDESSSSVTAASSELTCSNHGEFLEAGFERNFVPGQSTLRTTEEVQTLLLHSTKRLLGQEGGKSSRREETTNALGTEKSDSLVRDHLQIPLCQTGNQVTGHFRAGSVGSDNESQG